MQLKIKKLTETAIVPRYAHSTDSGMDLHYDGEEMLLYIHQHVMLSTGISIQLPPNTEAQVRSRSGLAAKYGISVTHGVGTIDEGYTGEIKVLLINHGNTIHNIKRGDRIAQMVICPVLRPEIIEVNTLDKSERGDNGFGSTGVAL